MGNAPIQEKPVEVSKQETFQVPNYDLTLVDRNHDGKFSISDEACATIVDGKTKQVTYRTLSKNDRSYREFKSEFKRLNLDISKPVTVQTLEGYLGKIRASQDKIDVDAMATNMRAYTSNERLDMLSPMLERLNHALDRDSLDKSKDPQALRVSLLQARDMIVAKLEGTHDKKQILKLLAVGNAIERASYRLSISPDKYHYEEKFSGFRNGLQPRIPLK